MSIPTPNGVASTSTSFWLLAARQASSYTCHSSSCLTRSMSRGRLNKSSLVCPGSHAFRAAANLRGDRSHRTGTTLVTAGLKAGDSMKDYPDYYRVFQTTDGGSVSLSSFLGQKPVVLFFYPKAGTPGCTKQVCKFRDEYQKFLHAGAVVLGISGDTLQEQVQFASANQLPFTLVCDPSNLLRRGFGIKADLFGALPGRETFVIDAEGRCVLAFNDQFNPEKHIEEALRMLSKLKQGV